MATGQTLLDHMEDLFPELQLQAGEADVAKGLRCLNRVQDMFETLLAQHPNVSGSSIGTISTVALTESTAFPTGVIRLDGLDMLDTNSLPLYAMSDVTIRGGHRYASRWPWSLFVIASSSGGRPNTYWTNGRNIYWGPIPDTVYNIRWYGYQQQSDITASGTFNFSDNCILPFAALACRLARTGVDDPVTDYSGIAKEVLEPLIDTLRNFDRSAPRMPRYRYSHDT